MEYYSAVKRNKVLIPATTWIKLEKMLNKRNQTQKATYFMIPFLENINRQIHRDRKKITDLPGMGVERRNGECC